MESNLELMLLTSQSYLSIDPIPLMTRIFFAKLFLIIGSIFGFLSLLGADYVNQIALFIGVENATLLYLYFGLVTIF